MSKFDQMKTIMQLKKVQKELERQTITIEKGDGAVKVEISGDQKLKKVRIDPELINLEDIEELEGWVEEAVREAISSSQKIAAEKMKPMMGALGDIGL